VEKSGTLSWNINGIAVSLNITVEEVREYFTDGRRVSFVLERRLARDLLGQLAPSEGAGYDILDSNGGKWEVRSIAKGGIYFCPSYMVGSGRSFEESGFLAKLDEIEGYIISDITKFPEIPYWLVSSAQVRSWWRQGVLGMNCKISRRKALELVGSLTDRA
jgi:hypothetical protein